MLPLIIKKDHLERDIRAVSFAKIIRRRMNIGRIFYYLLVFIPLCIFFGIFTQFHLIIFVTAILSLVPLARIMGYAANEIVLQSNPMISGLISATFGNMIELLIAVFALKEGKHLIPLIQASLIGSIICNILLLVGLSIFVGGLRYRYQRFNNQAVAVSSTMLIIVVAGLAIPSVYAYITPQPQPDHLHLMSVAVAVVMAIIYIAGLVFSLWTHKDMFEVSSEVKSLQERPVLSKQYAAFILFLSVLVVSIICEFLVKTVETVATTIGITQTFIGIVLVGIVTNIAENATAIRFAIQNKINVSIEIGLNSAIQIALFVVPIIMIVSSIFSFGFTLVFSMFEILAVILAVLIINYLSSDGRCNWLEGAQLLSVYFIIAIAFFFIKN
ncbi:MAG: calcium/proton exchanger [Candidatus Thermoplasmatota archaeon]